MAAIDKFSKELDNIEDEGLWTLFGRAKEALQKRGLARSRNIVGERGEFLAVETYNKTPGLPNLQAAPAGTQNVDALSRKGDRYSIKTITKPNSTTGVFYGLGTPEDKAVPDKKFEYVIIVVIDKHFQPKKILEIAWEQFLKFRRWHKRMQAWNLNVTKRLLKEARVIF